MSYADVLTAVRKREIIVDSTACGVIGVIGFIIATAAGAFIRIPLPFTPVPLTLQTFFVLFSGAVLGRKLGILSQAGYVILGIIGLPVFAGAHAGAAYFMGPTGGYLVGFALAAWVVGRILNEKSGFASIVAAMFIGAVVYFGIGAAWLAIFLKISLSKAFVLGVLPFVPGDAIKIIVAASIFGRVEDRAREIYRD